MDFDQDPLYQYEVRRRFAMVACLILALFVYSFTGTRWVGIAYAVALMVVVARELLQPRTIGVGLIVMGIVLLPLSSTEVWPRSEVFSSPLYRFLTVAGMIAWGVILVRDARRPDEIAYHNRRSEQSR